MIETTAIALQPLWNRSLEWELRLTMVAEAKHFLYVSIYYIEYDEYGTAFLNALEDACRRRVAVNLLLDGFGQTLGGVVMNDSTKRALASHLNRLRAAGATITHYRPPQLMQRRLGGGQHVKIQVSEQGEALFGSSNVTGASYTQWHEFSVAVRGPIVRTLLESYRTIGGTVKDTHLQVLGNTAQAGMTEVSLRYWCCNPNLGQGWSGPLGWRGPNEVTNLMKQMLDAARERVCLTAFYFKPIPTLIRAMEAAAHRGVRVEVYHSHCDALEATNLAWIAAAASYDRLLAAGIHIFEHRRGEHSKIVLIDDAWVAFGSYNFEDAAHDRLAEAMIDTHDTALVREARSIFESLSADPAQEAVRPHFRRNLSVQLRLQLAIMRHFKRWM